MSDIKKLVKAQEEKAQQSDKIVGQQVLKEELKRLYEFDTLEKMISWPQGVRRRWYN